MNNKGYLLLWSVVILMVVSMIVFSYANTVSTNYNIVQSIYRAEYTTQAAYGGVELAIEHYENYPNEIHDFSTNATIGTSIELYPDLNGDLGSYIVLEEYNIESIIAEKIDENIVKIITKATYEKATREVSVLLTVNSETTFSVDEIIIN